MVLGLSIADSRFESTITNIFSAPDRYNRENMQELADILRPIFNSRTQDQGFRNYDPVVDCVKLVDQVVDADWIVMPMTWNHYHRTRQIDRAVAFINEFQNTGTPIRT